MRIPPELDRLAWSVAERGDPRARAAFAERHPEWADELERRVLLVAERRESGRPVDFAAHAPLPSSRRPLGLAPALLGGLLVGGLALAFALSRLAPARPQSAPRPTTATPSAPLASAPGAAADLAPAPNPQVEPPAASPPSAAEADAASGDLGASTPDPATETPTTIRLRRTGLHAALGLIGEAGGLRVRVDPNVPDPEVEDDLVDLTPREMIARLGARYGFRVVPEGPRSLYVVPLAEGDAGGSAEGPPPSAPRENPGPRDGNR